MSSAAKLSQGTNSKPTVAPHQPVRWWPAVLICALTLLAVGWLQFQVEDSQQHRNTSIAGACVLGLLLLLLWCLCLSRLGWLVRLLTLGAFVVFVGTSLALVRIRGVTGDLLPIFEWRWKQSQMTRASEMNPPNSGHTAPEGPFSAGPATNDWPQFLGPNRNSTLTGPTLESDWEKQPPSELWRRNVGPGWSGFAVAKGLAITQEQHGAKEAVTCYEAISGRPLWTHEDEARYFTTIAGEGPRATPTIDGDRVYTIGATGLLNCLDLQTGKSKWSKQVLSENGGQVPAWGLSVSPLVLDQLVVISVGGGKDKSLVAYDKLTGQFRWGAGHDRVSYSSPVLVSLGSQRQVLCFNAGSVAGHNPEDGRLLWEHKWPSSNPNVAVPVLLPGNRVLIGSGYGVGSATLQLEARPDGAWEAKRLWKSPRLRPKFTNVVSHEGHIYGLDDGTLVCLDADNGNLKWKGGRYGHGQMILVGELLLLTTENGQVVCLEPNPQEPRELGRFIAFRTKTWNPPTLTGALLLVRHDLEAACFRLPLRP